MWSACSLLVTLILGLLSSSYVAFAYEEVLVEDVWTTEPACMSLPDREGNIHIKFTDYKRIYHCALTFVVPLKHKVFLHLVSEPRDCSGYQLYLYDSHVLLPSTQLTPPRDNFCRVPNITHIIAGKGEESEADPETAYPRSFIASTNYFTIQLVNQCREKFKPLDLSIYYQYFTKEEDLITNFCDQCGNKTFAFHQGICDNLTPNCSGLYQVRRTNLSSSGVLPGDEKGPSSNEIFGILIAAAIVITILVVAAHCGGLPSANGSRGRGMSNAGTQPGFAPSTSYSGKGPATHV